MPTQAVSSRVALIACSKTKKDKPAPASALYDSTLFNLSYQYARARQPDAIYVLSAKHGLVPEGTVIDPYDETLHGKSAQEIRKWAGQVLDSIGSRHDVSDTRFLILAGRKYRKNLVPELPSCEIPMAGLGIGERLHFLKTQLESGLAQ